MKSDWVSAPDMWEWQKYSRLNGVPLTEWELFAERVREGAGISMI